MLEQRLHQLDAAVADGQPQRALEVAPGLDESFHGHRVDVELPAALRTPGCRELARARDQLAPRAEAVLARHDQAGVAALEPGLGERCVGQTLESWHVCAHTPECVVSTGAELLLQASRPLVVPALVPEPDAVDGPVVLTPAAYDGLEIGPRAVTVLLRDHVLRVGEQEALGHPFPEHFARALQRRGIVLGNGAVQLLGRLAVPGQVRPRRQRVVTLTHDVLPSALSALGRKTSSTKPVQPLEVGSSLPADSLRPRAHAEPTRAARQRSSTAPD